MADITYIERKLESLAAIYKDEINSQMGVVVSMFVNAGHAHGSSAFQRNARDTLLVEFRERLEGMARLVIDMEAASDRAAVEAFERRAAALRDSLLKSHKNTLFQVSRLKAATSPKNELPDPSDPFVLEMSNIVTGVIEDLRRGIVGNARHRPAKDSASSIAAYQSQVLVNSPGATVSQSIHQLDIVELQQTLSEAHALSGELGLEQSELEALRSQIAALEAQLKSPRPDRSIISVCGRYVARLFGTAANAAAAALGKRLIEQLPPL